MSSFDLNKVMLIGNVGKNPEEHTFDNGSSVTKFTLATNESWKNKQSGEYETVTEWHNVVCFNEFVSKAIMRNVTVGTKVYVEGESRTRRYEKDGATQFFHEIDIPKYSGDMKVLVRGTESDTDSAANAAPQGTDGFKDDIPF